MNLLSDFNLNLSDQAEYWNRLYATAIGQSLDGSSVRVSPKLAEQIRKAYQGWRAFYVSESQGSLKDNPIEFLGWGQQARGYETRYAELRKLMADEGVNVDEIPESVLVKGVNIVLDPKGTVTAIVAAAALVLVTPAIVSVVVHLWGNRGKSSA
jgi:hypothetical protein